MQSVRPKNLNLFTIYFPIPSIVSILHRVSGVFLFLLLPILIALFQYSLTESGFAALKHWVTMPLAKLFFLAILAPIIFHIVAGIRHLLSDIHIGDTLPAGRVTAWLTFILTILLLATIGVWIW